MVPLPPEEAFVLFTPRGEERWVEGWEPVFRCPVGDDSAPGTVFETTAHGESTIWVVVDRRPGRLISYARITPGSRAGTVTVTLEPVEASVAASEASGASLVRVTYELTALSDEGEREVRRFAGGYQAYLSSWEEAIRGSIR
ncbi:hypothetical protein [Nonomuraea recticatena]|uniref:hypothetical protein n=1 Tax=Nonomuraea recticatena TaxID=46178 RepID=UPI0031F96AB8